MKKIILFAVLPLLFLFACKGKPVKKIDAVAEEARQQMSLELVVQIDSLVAQELKYSFQPLGDKIQTGEFKLTDKQKKIKPEYLISPTIVDELHTLQQKNAALIYILMDRGVAKLYDMPTEAYDEAFARLRVDLNLSDIKNTFNVTERVELKKQEEMFFARFKKEQQEGTLHLFVGRGVAMITESLYLLSQNPEVLQEAVTNEEVNVLAHRIKNITVLLDKILAYYPEIEPERNAIAVYQPLVTVTTKAELIERVKLMKPQIEAMRTDLLD